MFIKRYSFASVVEMACCGCFGFSFTRKQKTTSGPKTQFGNNIRQELLEHEVDYDDEEEEKEEEEEDNSSYGEDMSDSDEEKGDHLEFRNPSLRSEDILIYRTENGLICREVPVKETHKVVRSEDENGNKMVNEYVREYKIGSGSYGKVVLYRSQVDGKHYAIKAFHKSHLLKLRVAPGETAMTDVHREVLIMKMLNHPNIVNLIEVINDPNMDHFYMVLEYVEGKWLFEGAGPPGGLGQKVSRKYLRDTLCGLMYLHAHNIVHGDIKPDNLLVTASGKVKIGDFSVSQVFEDENDELRRSPGTPVFTAPECCLGLTYHGKAADTWALGVTLYCMIMGKYPFLGDTLQDTYDKIVNDPIRLPLGMNPQLKNLLEGLLCKDPTERFTLETVAAHPWVVADSGPITQFLCWCKRNQLQRDQISDGSITDALINTD